MNWRAWCFVILSLIFFVSASAHSEEFTLSTFSVGDTDEAIPIIKMAYKMLGHVVTVETLPAQRSIMLANNGVMDGELIRVDGISKKYTNLIQIPVPIMKTVISVITRRDSTFFPVKWSDLRSKVIGIPLGVQLVLASTKGMDTIKVRTPAALLKMVQEGRVEAVVMPLSMATGHPDILKDLRIVEPAIDVTPLYHYVHVKHRDLVPGLTRALVSLQKDAIH